MYWEETRDANRETVDVFVSILSPTETQTMEVVETPLRPQPRYEGP